MPPNETVIRAQGLSKIYPAAKAPVTVFRQLSLEVAQGEILGVVGPSGVGKSTLLNILGGLDTPTEGTVEVLGMELTRLSPAARSAFRKSRIAYVFQFHHLLHELNLVENVALPLLIRGGRLRSSLIEAREALASVGLSDLGSRYRGANSNAAASRAPFPRNRASCCWTSRRAVWIRPPRTG